MKPNRAICYRKSPVTGAAILAFVSALLWFAFIPQEPENQTGESDGHNLKDRYETQDLNLDNEKNRKVMDSQSMASRVRHFLNPDRPATKEYVNQQFIEDPLSGIGVNDYAIKHYDLSVEQVATIAKAVTDLRVQIANHVVQNLKILEEPGDAQHAFVYHGSEEYLNDMRTQLKKQMEKIVNTEFGDASLNALMSDGRFFQGGGSDIYFYINPGIENGAGLVKTVRYEYRNKQGQRGRHWEGTADNLREGLLMDFDWFSK